MPKSKTRSKSLENIVITGESTTNISTNSNRSIYSEISFLKRRIHLVEGERKANYERNEEELKKNEIVIQDLRQKCQELKKKYNDVLKGSDNYFQKISGVFDGNEKKANEFKGKNYEESADILENKIGDMRNKLNLVEFQRKQVKDKLDSIQRDEKNLKDVLEKSNRVFNPRYDELIGTDNQTALMQMRIIEAENIQSKYKIMIETLKQENYQKSNQIKELEKVKTFQGKEVVKLKEVLENALLAKKEAKNKLVEVEQETMKEYADREEKLYQARIKLKEIRERMDTIGTKLTYPKFHMMHRDSSLADGVYGFGSPFLNLMNQDGAKGQNELEKVYNILKEMTGESNPIEITQRFTQQRAHTQELVVDEQKLTSEIRKIKLRKRYLQDKLNQLQFSGGVQGEELDSSIESVQNEISKLTNIKEDMEKEVETYESVMDQVYKKLTDICYNNKISVPVPVAVVPEPEKDEIGVKIIAILNALMIQTEEAIYDQDNVFMISPTTIEREYNSDTDLSGTGTGMGPSPAPAFRYGSMTGLNEISRPLGHPQLDILSLPPSEQRQNRDRLTPSPLPLPFPTVSQLPSPSHIGDVTSSPKGGGGGGGKSIGKKSDSSEEEEAASRNYIKRQSQVIVEAKTRKGRFNSSNITMPRAKRH